MAETNRWDRPNSPTHDWGAYNPGDKVYLGGDQWAVRNPNDADGPWNDGQGAYQSTVESIGGSPVGDSPHWGYFQTSGGGEEVPDYSGIFQQMSDQQAEANRIAKEQIEISKRMADIADEQYNYYKSNFQPLEQELFAKARRGIDADYAASVAGNRVEQAFNSAEGVGNRYFERLGISAEDPRLSAITSDMQFARMAAEAGAKNGARQNAIDTTKQMRHAVAGMGRGMPASSLGMFGASAQSIGQAANSQAAGAQGVLSGQLRGLNMANNNAMAQNTANSNYNQFLADRSFMQDLNNANAQAQGWGLVGQIGGIAGKLYSDGAFNRETTQGQIQSTGGGSGFGAGYNSGSGTRTTGYGMISPYV